MSAEGTVTASVLSLVLVDGDRVAVFDTGNGVGAGKLVPTLEALGIGAAGVTQVVMSHWHPDHINGLSTDGVLTFPNAQVFFPQPEYDFLQNAPADVVGGAVAKLQPALDAEQVAFYNAEDEVVSGVQAIATHGHTPRPYVVPAQLRRQPTASRGRCRPERLCIAAQPRVARRL
ncbi:MAG: MBL fold metallo-hydrolase [Anaerolineae bacterium]|nr:MBL fold metallo-hydrolase [Anaerolineae bacterium]